LKRLLREKEYDCREHIRNQKSNICGVTTRVLGNSDLSIVPLVFGGNVFGWTIDEKQSFVVLDVFIDHGFNAIDTADVYSSWAPGNKGGESETILGRWIKARPGIRGNDRDRYGQTVTYDS